MKISIITATYNRASTISRCLNSLKCQNYDDIESLIIDGASTDCTLSEVRPYVKKDDVLLSEPDSGIYDALNKGLAMATGEVIGFLHSDDFYAHENVLSDVMAVFSDASIDVVYGDACFFRHSNIHKTWRVYRSSKLSKKNLAWGRMPAHPSMFIRRRIYQQIGYFNKDFAIAADYEFLCRLVTKIEPNVYYIPSILTKMQLGGVSTSGIRSTIQLNSEVLRALSANGIYSNIFMLLSKYPSKIYEFLKI